MRLWIGVISIYRYLVGIYSSPEQHTGDGIMANSEQLAAMILMML